VVCPGCGFFECRRRSPGRRGTSDRRARNLLLRLGLAHAKAEPESSILFVQASHDQVGVYRVTYLVAYSARSLQLRALLVREG
jgi:hypothetical protein